MIGCFCCERKNQVERGRGGVACCVAETVEYDRLFLL